MSRWEERERARAVQERGAEVTRPPRRARAHTQIFGRSNLQTY
jgi:hypothetical protein